MISFQIINSIFNIVPDTENTENKQALEKPKLKIALLDPFPTEYDAYYSDHFSIRQRLIKYFNALNIFVFKKSPIPTKVLIGKNGWLYMVGTESQAYKGENNFNDLELDSLKLELEYRQQYLADRGCKLYVAIAPTKANIYPEFLPNYEIKTKNDGWVTQINKYLKENSSINVIELSQTLIENKNKGFLFHKIDNHMNERGGFIVANKILYELQKQFPMIDTIDYNSMDVIGTISDHGNIAQMLSDIKFFKDSAFTVSPKTGFLSQEAPKAGYPPPEYFAYSWDYENVRETQNKNKPKILLISDSFGHAVFPYLSEQSSKCVKIFDAWQFMLNENIVESEKPDIMIFLGLEANFKTNILKHQSRLW